MAAVIEQQMNPAQFDPAFCAAVLRVWRSKPVNDVLRARGVALAVIKRETSMAGFTARQHADESKNGLHPCALPSCGKREHSVREFRLCSGCRAVMYCSVEHQTLHWKEHRKACKEAEKARNP